LLVSLSPCLPVSPGGGVPAEPVPPLRLRSAAGVAAVVRPLGAFRPRSRLIQTGDVSVRGSLFQGHRTAPRGPGLLLPVGPGADLVCVQPAALVLAALPPLARAGPVEHL